MKRALVLVLMLVLPAAAWAHRLDEYLQASILTIHSGSIELDLRLVPGVAVAPTVIQGIDTNGDGVFSPAEQRAYGMQVLRDLALAEDGDALRLQLVSFSFPAPDRMKQGAAEIELSFAADRTQSPGDHEITLANHHQPGISVYLANALMPDDRHLQITSQSRNRSQSVYRLGLTTAAGDASRSITWSGFAGAFHLGARHIAEGTDHLLFVLTLLFPAPLLVMRHRWREGASVRQSLIRILRVVTAFTIGHSLTLALAGFGVVRLPGRPVEVLIAVSILVSALHAFRPLFAGREAIIAAAFGLVHGLAFASALNELGITGWYRLVSLLGFNLGIEVMQLAVVAAVLPSLLLLSRTPLYAAVRIVGAGLSFLAASAWVFERLTGRTSTVAALVEHVAKHGGLVAGDLFAFAVLTWVVHRLRRLHDSDAQADVPSPV